MNSSADELKAVLGNNQADDIDMSINNLDIKNQPPAESNMGEEKPKVLKPKRKRKPYKKQWKRDSFKPTLELERILMLKILHTITKIIAELQDT